jgi:hypothetical protein
MPPPPSPICANLERAEGAGAAVSSWDEEEEDRPEWEIPEECEPEPSRFLGNLQPLAKLGLGLVLLAVLVAVLRALWAVG